MTVDQMINTRLQLLTDVKENQNYVKILNFKKWTSYSNIPFVFFFQLKPSPLTFPDLVSIALDVAKGCRYLEDMHFVHRWEIFELSTTQTLFLFVWTNFILDSSSCKNAKQWLIIVVSLLF